MRGKEKSYGLQYSAEGALTYIASFHPWGHTPVGNLWLTPALYKHSSLRSPHQGSHNCCSLIRCFRRVRDLQHRTACLGNAASGLQCWCVELHCIALHCVGLHSVALHCIVSCCTLLCPQGLTALKIMLYNFASQLQYCENGMRNQNDNWIISDCLLVYEVVMM